MVKTEITDGICLVTVKTKENVIECLSFIKDELKNRNVKIFYSSASGFFEKNQKIVIAVAENDLFPLLASFGCIKDKAGITSYTLNCSNCLVLWEGAKCNMAEKLKKDSEKIRLLYESGRNGAVICESEVKQKILISLQRCQAHKEV